jgi:STE24 endopeptidase
MKLAFYLCVVLGLLAGGQFAPALAQEELEAQSGAPTGAAGPVEVTEAGPAEPFDVVAATRAYLDRLSPEEKASSDAYFEGGYWLQLWGLLYTLGVSWLFLGTGLSARLRDIAVRLGRWKPLQTILYIVLYLPIATVLFFPLTVYQGFFREHKYGLATQTFGPWFTEQMIGLVVSAVFLSVLLVPLYGVFRRAPKTWWAWGALVAVVFMIFGILIAPVYVDPLFNTYVPLEDPDVREPILSMARASSIDADRVYQFDASRQTNRISANVSGFAGTMAIRLNDNLLDRCSQAEIEAVMGHEIGHYALNHIYESIVFLGVVLVLGFLFVRWSFDRVVARWGAHWRVSGIGDLAGLPLLSALMAIFFFIGTPFLNTYIRVNEAEADLYGLHSAGQPEGFAEVALKLGEYRKLDPGPLEEWIFFDHPSGRARIEMAMRWKAEHLDDE